MSFLSNFLARKEVSFHLILISLHTSFPQFGVAVDRLKHFTNPVCLRFYSYLILKLSSDASILSLLSVGINSCIAKTEKLMLSHFWVYGYIPLSHTLRSILMDGICTECENKRF